MIKPIVDFNGEDDGLLFLLRAQAEVFAVLFEEFGQALAVSGVDLKQDVPVVYVTQFEKGRHHLVAVVAYPLLV